MKKRLVTLAAGAAILAAAAVPTGSAFAKKAPKPPGPVANAARCQVAISVDNELDREVAAATDPVDKAILQALEDNADAKIASIPGCTFAD